MEARLRRNPDTQRRETSVVRKNLVGIHWHDAALGLRDSDGRETSTTLSAPFSLQHAGDGMSCTINAADHRNLRVGWLRWRLVPDFARRVDSDIIPNDR
jgi:hypothetical protein